MTRGVGSPLRRAATIAGATTTTLPASAASSTDASEIPPGTR